MVGQVGKVGQGVGDIARGPAVVPGLPAGSLTAEQIEAAAWKAVLNKSELGSEWKSATDIAQLTGIGITTVRKTLKARSRAGEIESRIFNGFRNGIKVGGEFFKIDSSRLAQILA